MKGPTASDKFKVLEEDILSAVKVAIELKQNALASVLLFQMSALSIALQGGDSIDKGMKLLGKMAKACDSIMREIEEGL